MRWTDVATGTATPTRVITTSRANTRMWPRLPKRLARPSMCWVSRPAPTWRCTLPVARLRCSDWCSTSPLDLTPLPPASGRGYMPAWRRAISTRLWPPSWLMSLCQQPTRAFSRMRDHRCWRSAPVGGLGGRATECTRHTRRGRLVRNLPLRPRRISRLHYRDGAPAGQYQRSGRARMAAGSPSRLAVQSNRGDERPGAWGHA